MSERVSQCLSGCPVCLCAVECVHVSNLKCPQLKAKWEGRANYLIG